MTTSATGNRRGRYPRAVTPGFTLIEVLLVLTVLVIVAALVMPGLGAGSAQSRMKQAAEKVRTSWAKARLEAIESGRVLRFQCRIAGGWGFVAPATIPAEEVAAGLSGRSPEESGAAEGSGSTATPNDSSTTYELSRVTFKEVLVSQQPPEQAIGAGVSDGDFSAAVYFYPDGTTSDAEATIEDADGRTLRITLRGLSGSTKIEERE